MVESYELRRRKPQYANVQQEPFPEETRGSRKERSHQHWWTRPKTLFPQINRSQIEWITIGHIIGQGISLGTASALKTGGPAGMLLGYGFTSSVMYFLLHSIGEIVTFRPDIAGVIGLPARFVDQALAFAMGINAYYNWTFIIPYQISSAALLTSSFAPDDWDEEAMKALQLSLTGIMLALALAINCLRMDYFGSVQKGMALIKIWSYILLILACFIISGLPVSASLATPNLLHVSEPFACGDTFGLPRTTVQTVLDALNNDTLVKASKSPAQLQIDTINSRHPDLTIRLGLKYWTCPGPFVNYRNIPGSGGQFLGTWQVLMQAAFSFIGTEVPGMATGELKNPELIILPAMKTVWLEITVLYLLAVFAIGLVVPSTYVPPFDPNANRAGLNLANTSPFIAALTTAQIPVLPRLIIIIFIHSAWTAAVSSIYSSTRLLFLISECGYIPSFFRTTYFRPGPLVPKPIHSPVADQHDTDGGPEKPPGQPTSPRPRANHDGTYFLPWVAVITAGIASTIAFYVTSPAKVVFQWLTLMTTCAAILHWIAILVTYVVWYRGTIKAERRDERKKDEENATVGGPSVETAKGDLGSTDSRAGEDSKVVDGHEPSESDGNPASGEERIDFKARNPVLYRHRHWFQPAGAGYALGVSILVLVFNGWAIFTVPDGWLIAETDKSKLNDWDVDLEYLMPAFITSYLPLPLFLLAIFGYKLIFQSQTQILNDEQLATAPTVPIVDEDIHWTMRVPQAVRWIRNFIRNIW